MIFTLVFDFSGLFQAIFYYYQSAIGQPLISANPKHWIKEKSGAKNCPYSKEYYTAKKALLKYFKDSKVNNISLKDNLENRILRAKVQKIKRNCIKNYWENDISARAKSNQLNWEYLKKFKNNESKTPENLNSNTFAERFHDLSFDYTPIKRDENEGKTFGEKFYQISQIDTNCHNILL